MNVSFQWNHFNTFFHAQLRCSSCGSGGKAGCPQITKSSLRSLSTLLYNNLDANLKKSRGRSQNVTSRYIHTRPWRTQFIVQSRVIRNALMPDWTVKVQLWPPTAGGALRCCRYTFGSWTVAVFLRVGSKTQTTVHGTDVVITHELTSLFTRPNFAQETWDVSRGMLE